MSRTDIPDYFVYGEPARSVDVGFLHVERVRDRNSVHRGQVAPHRHGRMAQLTFWTSGSGTYRIEDNAWTFAAPAVSFVPSSVVHGFDIAPDADAIVVSMADDFIAGLERTAGLRLSEPRFAMSARPSDWSQLGALLELLFAEYRAAPMSTDAVLPMLVSAAVAYLDRLADSHTATPAAPQVALALALRRSIDAHYREKWTLERFAGELGTTPHLLNKAARDVLGASAKDLLMQRRLVEAKRLLLFTSRPVEDIAYEIGFADPAYFSRFFRVNAGEAPAQWRLTRTRTD